MELTGFAAPKNADEVEIIMRECHKEILYFFQLQPMDTADTLWSKHLITEEIYVKLLSVPDSDINKARQMVLNVKMIIQNNPQNYKVFLEFLRNDTEAKSLVTKLEKSVISMQPGLSVAEDSNISKCTETDPSAAISLSEMSNKRSESAMVTSIVTPQLNSIPSLNMPNQQTLPLDIVTRDHTGMGASVVSSKINCLPSSLNILQTSLQQTSPDANASYTRDQTDSLNHKEAVLAQLKKIEDDFIILKESLLNELKDRKVSVERLTTKISCLKDGVNCYVYNYWKKIVDRNFGNLNELFTYLNAKVWTILDYYLLGHIIECLKNYQLTMKLEAYTKQLNTFKKITKVSDFISCWRDSQIEQDIPDFENISIQCDEVPKTLSDLDDFRNSFKTRFFPSLIDCSSCIYYGKFQQKSAVSVIILYIPNDMADELLTKADKTSELFRKYKVSKMLIRNTEVFDRNEQATHDFQNTYSSEGKCSLTDIADDPQLGSPARLPTKQASTSSQSNIEDTVRRLEQQLDEFQIREEQLQIEKDRLQRRVEDSNTRAVALQRQVVESNTKYEKLQRQESATAEALEREVVDSKARVEVLQTQVIDSNTRADALQRQSQESNRRAESAEARIHQLERSLAETTQDLRQSEERFQIYCTHWAVRREEIELTGPDLGVGGWATVTVAKFRGARVAVKKIHNQIISRHNIQLFQREMNIAARLHHPNLVQFIGATVEGEMTIIMELMATSLRSQLEAEEYFQPKWVKAISLDVALGLNYLHLFQPDPIVHRDISSANVLLEQLPLNKWRAKLTDYGSVNVVRQLRTENPGSPAYAAPEASNPHLQSPKMDIYSFGALILEMLTGRLPTPEERPGMFRKVQHEQLLRLIRRNLSENPEDRPSASAIISELYS